MYSNWHFRVGFSAAGSVASMSFAQFIQGLGLIANGHDCSKRILGNPCLNHAFLSPTTSHPEYKDFLQNFLEESCDVYIPFLDQELMLCAQIIEEYPELSKKMAISSKQSIQICDDKLSLKHWAEDLGIHTVQTTTRIPAFVKPRIGSGGKHSLLVKRQEVLDALIREPVFLSDYIVEDYMDGILVSVDAVWDCDSEVMSFFCRQRPNNSGISSLSCAFIDKPINARIFKDISVLGKSLGFHGACSIQFMVRDSNIYLLEVNPRIGGSAHHSHFLGSDIVASYFDIVLGERFDTTSLTPSAMCAKQVLRFYTDIIYE